ncbi:MAG: hypothetical protein AB2L07_03700 [Thermoanaerobaculaceae bacterium]
MSSRLCASGLIAAVLLAGAVAHAGAPGGGETTVSVRFELNDAQVKGRMLEGVQVRVLAPADGAEVAACATGGDGRCAVRVTPGAYRVSFRLDGFVPYTSGGTDIREDGQVVTVSLTRPLEATESAGRQVRVILNWGSRSDQVKDADSHLACACGNGHVYYQAKVHEGDGHRVELDVDDTDWGGPETVTLTDPPPGSYLYWVHDYSGPPATLGTSDVVVRVVIGDQEAGEFRVLRGVTQRAWRPFKAIEVGGDGRPQVVRFTEDELAEGKDLEVPADLQPPETLALPTPGQTGGQGPVRQIPIGCAFAFPLVALFSFWLLGQVVKRMKRR